MSCFVFEDVYWCLIQSGNVFWVTLLFFSRSGFLMFVLDLYLNISEKDYWLKFLHVNIKRKDIWKLTFQTVVDKDSISFCFEVYYLIFWKSYSKDISAEQLQWNTRFCYFVKTKQNNNVMFIHNLNFHFNC